MSCFYFCSLSAPAPEWRIEGFAIAEHPNTLAGTIPPGTKLLRCIEDPDNPGQHKFDDSIDLGELATHTELYMFYISELYGTALDAQRLLELPNANFSDVDSNLGWLRKVWDFLSCSGTVDSDEVWDDVHGQCYYNIGVANLQSTGPVVINMVDAPLAP